MRKILTKVIWFIPLMLLVGCSSLVDHGIRSDGSYYTRVGWSNADSSSPATWVNNILDDSTKRGGGVFSSKYSGEPVEIVLDFFGADREFSYIRINSDIASEDANYNRLASHINVFYSNDEKAADNTVLDKGIDQVQWNKVLDCPMEKVPGWRGYTLPYPVKAKFVRIQYWKNFSTPEAIVPNLDSGEVKIYYLPPKKN